MLEIVLTRRTRTPSSLALRMAGRRPGGVEGQPVCVVETTKATVEVEAPGAGTIVQLFEEGVEVELGKTVAYVAESADELASLETDAEREKPAPKPAATDRKATRKATELAERHGVDLAAIEKRGFITEKDVEELIARQKAASPERGSPLAGVSTENVTLPASFELDDKTGVLDPEFLDSLRSDPDSFRRLSSDEKISTLRGHGAEIGADVVLGEGSLVVAPQVVIEDGVEIGPRATIRCEEIVAIGASSQFGADLELACRRAFLGAGIWAGRSIRFGGGGHRDPWAVLTVGDLAFVGDEAFVNVCRPVLIGREVFLTMRSLIVTHNIGHSVLEGFENRFAPGRPRRPGASRPRRGDLRRLPNRRRGDRRVELLRHVRHRAGLVRDRRARARHGELEPQGLACAPDRARPPHDRRPARAARAARARGVGDRRRRNA